MLFRESERNQYNERALKKVVVERSAKLSQEKRQKPASLKKLKLRIYSQSSSKLISNYRRQCG